MQILKTGQVIIKMQENPANANFLGSKKLLYMVIGSWKIENCKFGEKIVFVLIDQTETSRNVYLLRLPGIT